MHVATRRSGIVCLFLLLPLVVLPAQTPIEPDHITIAAEPDYPPYSYIDAAGEPTGFAVELFRAVAEVMGLPITIETGYWKTIKEELAEGNIDALPLVGRTPEREEIFDFTVPYLSLHGGIVVREEEDRFRRLEDLTGYRVAVMAGDNAEEFLRRRNTEYEIRTFPTFSDALDDLSSGESDAVVMQRLVALRILQQDRFTDLRLLDESISEFRQDFCFAVTAGNKELLALLNEGLSLVIAEGTYRRLQTVWFSPLELPSGRILVGGDDNYPPFEFLDDEGNPAGYNVDITRAIAREMGLNIEIRLGPWVQIMGMLERGEIDIIQGMVYSAERDKVFDFSPGHTVHQHVVVAHGVHVREIPSAVEELKGHKIVVQDGDIMHYFVREHGLTENLTVVDSQEEALARVVSGASDYALGSRLTAMHLINKNGWDTLTVGRQSLVSQEYGFAVRKGNLGLLSHFSEGLAVLEETGEYHRIHEKWLGVYTPIDYSFRRISRVVLLVLLPVLLVLAIVIFWNRSLRKQVARSTAELKRSMQRTQWLNTLATSYLVRKDAPTLIQETLEALESHFSGVKTAFLALDASGTVRIVQSTDGSPREADLASAPELLDSFHPTTPTVVCDVLTDRLTGPVGETLAAQGVRAFAVVAVPVDGVQRGLIAFTSPVPRTWSEHELVTLEEHGHLLTIILENEGYQRMMEEANSTLASSLEENKILLKEIHHRVKNNLNVIVSLLRLQEDQIASVQDAREAFKQSRNRIYSMALVHESLYRSDYLSEVELDRYIGTLVEQLKDTSSGEKEIRYTCNLEGVRMDITYAVPCGIIINELVSNAQKHAFPDATGGEITVTLAMVEEKNLVLTVRDNGVGIPETLSPDTMTSLGLKLVNILSAQINGTVTFSSNGGTRVELTFPLHRGP